MGSAGLYLGKGVRQGGGWIDATMKELLEEEDIELTVAAACASEDKKVVTEEGMCYYGISDVQCKIGKGNKKNLPKWEKVIKEVKPDILQVWGTEFYEGYYIGQVAKKYNIPFLYYIQGVTQAIANYPLGGVSKKEYRRYISIFSYWKLWKEKRFQRQLQSQAIVEKQMTRISDGVIGDNEWFSAYFDGVKTYRHSLPINESFVTLKHVDEEAEAQSITCCAGRNAHKGLHVLIKALPSIKKEYPNVKVYIPGNMNSRSPKCVFEPAYITYINKLIDELEVQENVVFCGQLTPQQMAERMNQSQIFVLPSCIENHSSTLREAMYVGLPCITTMVGSVHEFLTHKENGLIFRYPEAEQLAYQIKYLLGNAEERKRLGANAYSSIREKYPQSQMGVIKNIYEEVIKNKKKGT